VIYGETGRYDRAVEDFDAAIRLNPNYAEALNNRGIAKRKMGDLIGGNADIARAKAMITNGTQP
jgi:tetratricopeptide (TPR) repeat protein